MNNNLEANLLHSWSCVWDKIDDEERNEINRFIERYKSFLDKGKTERKAVKEIIKMAKLKGFISLEEALESKKKICAGDKIYYENREKSLVLYKIGEEDLRSGVNIIASHLDSPRIDLKPFPLYEEEGLSFFKTHYYGGIKKYQWPTIPLAIHGLMFKKDGTRIDISIGDCDDDPVFFITDLLPHLSKDQMEKKLSEAITGEGLNVLNGSMPILGDYENRVKLNIMSILNESYDIEEIDFSTAELQVVPAGRSRDVGIDRSMVSGYGQDDRACVYSSLEAILDVKNNRRTSVAIFMDKEETGSVGNTGMESKFFELSLAELLNAIYSDYSELELKRVYSKSRVISADTVASYDPNFPEVLDKKNAPFLGNGVVLVRYTGVRGKVETNDANAEYLSEIRRIFESNDIVWQMGELGKVDQGGGGTVAYMLANYGMEVVDCGVSLLNVHAPNEIASKADIYMAKKAYMAFYKG